MKRISYRNINRGIEPGNPEHHLFEDRHEKRYKLPTPVKKELRELDDDERTHEEAVYGLGGKTNKEKRRQYRNTYNVDDHEDDDVYASRNYAQEIVKRAAEIEEDHKPEQETCSHCHGKGCDKYDNACGNCDGTGEVDA